MHLTHRGRIRRGQASGTVSVPVLNLRCLPAAPPPPKDGQEYEGSLWALGESGTTNPTRNARLAGAVDEEIGGLALLGRATRRVRYGYSLRTGTGTDTLPANANPPAWFALSTLEAPYKVVITEYHLARLPKMRIIWSLSSCVLTAAT